MKRLLSLLIWAIALTGSIHAQNPAGGANAPKIGKVSGAVVDAASNQPIPFATVVLQKSKPSPARLATMPKEMQERIQNAPPDSSVVAGMVSDEKGRFNLENLPYGTFKLKVSFIGYKAIVKTDLAITPNQTEISLGTITLAEIVNTKEIIITAERDLVQIAPDRKIYNIGKDLTATGGNGIDVMRNIPSVQVDMDNNVSMRGSGNIQVLIDGKPSNLPIATLLEQTPSSQIDRIEIITNPSAKYDSDSSAGIINIVLKRPNQAGYNTSISSNIGTGFKPNSFRTSNNIALNYRAPKYNAFVNLGYNRMAMGFKGSSIRTNLTNFIVSSTILQASDGYRIFDNGNFRAGFDYFFDNRTSLSLSGGYNLRDGGGFSLTAYTFMDGMDRLTDRYNRNTDNEGGNKGWETALDFRKIIGGAGHEFTANIAFNRGEQDDLQTYSEYDVVNNIPQTDLSQQRDNTIGNDHLFTAQTDYTRPLSNGGKLELGYKFTQRHNDQDYRATDYLNNTWQDNVLRTNQFILDEDIHAGYAMYTGLIGKFAYQVGIRAVQTYQRGNQKTTDQKFDQNYFNFFPTLNVRQTLASKNEVTLGYSRRQNRPNRWAMNPFPDYSDPVNIRVGNPLIKPEYVDALELGHMLNLKKGSLTSTVFYRHTSDLVSPINRLGENGISITTFENLKSADSYGLEFIATNRLSKAINLTTSLNGYRREVSGVSQNTNSGFSWSTRVNASLTLPYGINGQVSWDYQAPQPSAQGTMLSRQNTDVGFAKSFLNNSLMVSLRGSDIFDQRRFGMNNTDPDFIYSFTRRMVNRNVTLGATWNIGSNDRQNNQRNRKKNLNEDGSAGGDQF
ncbi:MAG: TonB-dependent receptor [Bacteroidetes Order II. Incertae sedis bacterium]|nr:TonB-dependent receptor [Bacteroidetes Order II. bacterium]